jgi:hypothetical protein
MTGDDMVLLSKEYLCKIGDEWSCLETSVSEQLPLKPQFCKAKA